MAGKYNEAPFLSGAQILERLYGAAGARELDRLAIDGGVAGIELMRRAGMAVLDELVNCWPGVSRLGICCGKGNNAGDGYVIARLAAARGLEVDCSARRSGSAQGDAATSRDDALSAGVAIRVSDDGRTLPAGEVLVDALLGTGIQPALREAMPMPGRSKLK